MILNRLLEQQLLSWKNKRNRKPLILRGARQVGKTTLIRHFAGNFRNRIILNLEKPGDRSFFERFDDVKNIIEALFLEYQLRIDEQNNTLLFIDEIQESPKAVKMLRYFYEEYPELYVISAGSLLEFVMKDIPGFPVGRVEYLYLHPLNFLEYLEATGNTRVVNEINHIPVKKFAHDTLLNLFHQYVIIGGMPEIVKVFMEEKSITALPPVYESLWETYKNDMEKYASNDTERRVINHVMSTAHLNIDRRIKFQNFGNSNYRSREVGEAIRNLNDAKIIQTIYPVTEFDVPLREDRKKAPRLQFLDTGLVNYILGIQPGMLSMRDLGSAYKGAIIPHVITQELISLNSIKYEKPNFWVRDKKQSSAEVDLVYAHQDKIIPIEIKSGSPGKLRSLHQFIDSSGIRYAVRICRDELLIEKAVTAGGTPYLLMNLPYYLGTKIPEYIEYFLSGYDI